VVIIVAFGVVTLWQVARTRLAQNLIVTCVALSSLAPIWLYFGVWATDPRVAESFDVRQLEIARQLNVAPPGAALFATPLNVGWIHDYWTIEFLLGRDAGARYSPFNGMLCAIAPAALPNGARYAIVASPEADDWRTADILQELFPNLQRTDVPVSGDRYPMAVYDVPPGTQPRINSETASVGFGDLVRLLKYQFTPQTPEQGKRFQIDVVWQTLKTASTNYNLFVHLIGAPKAGGSVVYAQYDGEPCARLLHTTSWHSNQLLVETFGFRVPADLPSGTYQLETGWYDQSTGTRLPVAQDTTSFKMAEFTLR
jgi:hypothetical protein